MNTANGALPYPSLPYYRPQSLGTKTFRQLQYRMDGLRTIGFLTIQILLSIKMVLQSTKTYMAIRKLPISSPPISGILKRVTYCLLYTNISIFMTPMPPEVVVVASRWQ